MSKKRSIEVYCFSCDLDCVVKVSEEDTRSIKIDEIFCPFCGELVENTEDDDFNGDTEADDSDDDERGHW